MSTNADTSAPLARSATLQLTRRKSSQDRIQDILKAARERAESIDPNSPAINPRLQPLLERERRASDPVGALSSGPDFGAGAGAGGENGHGVVTAQPVPQRNLNYQSTAEATSPAAATTRRRSALSKKASGQQSPLQTPLEDGNAPRDRSTGERQEEEPGWKRTLRYFKSIELENKGSVARDHLALERTFLAWLRTSLAFASIGIAITQLFRLNTSPAEDPKQAETLRHLGKPLGTAFLAVSILVLLLGYNRYLQGQYWVIQGKFPASRGTIMLVALIAFTVTLASLIVILAVQKTQQ